MKPGGVCAYCYKKAKGYLNDKAKNAQYHMNWYYKNHDEAKAIYAERDRERRLTNPAFVAKQQARKERVLNRAPYDDKAEIAQVYANCKRMNEIFVNRIYEVDHIVPIQHDKVSGLHVACNLRIVEQKFNRSKSNYFEG